MPHMRPARARLRSVQTKPRTRVSNQARPPRRVWCRQAPAARRTPPRRRAADWVARLGRVEKAAATASRRPSGWRRLVSLTRRPVVSLRTATRSTRGEVIALHQHVRARRTLGRRPCVRAHVRRQDRTCALGSRNHVVRLRSNEQSQQAGMHIAVAPSTRRKSSRPTSTAASSVAASPDSGAVRAMRAGSSHSAVRAEDFALRASAGACARPRPT
jgi:hypothetical protein